MAVENRDDGAKLRGNMSHLDIVSFQASDDITVAMTQINSENKRDSRTNSRSSSYQSSRSPSQGKYSNRSTPTRGQSPKWRKKGNMRTM